MSRHDATCRAAVIVGHDGDINRSPFDESKLEIVAIIEVLAILKDCNEVCRAMRPSEYAAWFGARGEQLDLGWFARCGEDGGLRMGGKRAISRRNRQRTRTRLRLFNR